MESRSLGVGYPEEVQAFGRRNLAFIESLDPLERAFNAVFTREWSSDEVADLVIFYLGHRCVDDFLEIFLLAANGHSGGSSALLRGLYERAVTAAYLHLNPGVAQDFLDYDFVQRRKVLTAIEKLPIEVGGSVEEREQLESRFQAVRERFVVTDCKKCGTTRINGTWNELDFVSMAYKSGRLAALVAPAYYAPLSHAHSTLKSISANLEQKDGALTVRTTPNHDEIDLTLQVAHAVILEVLRTQLEHFGLTDCEGTISCAVGAYRTAWGVDATAQHAHQADGQ